MLPLVESIDSYDTIALTHFSKDQRMSVKLQHESSHRIISHVQGVDTILVSNALLYDQMQHNRAFSYKQFTRILDYFHDKCYDSFYQDDYIIAFAMNIAGIVVKSIWNNFNVAGHIEGVSKNNSQMHMNSKVFVREHNTKLCIQQYADAVYHLIYPNEHHSTREYEL